MPTMNTSGSPSQNGNSSNATAAASPTSAPTVALSSYDELMSVASSLSESAASGGLDTGYDITDVAMALPDDVCGVAGGDGTTCYDACGVANGDNSTCADVCGKVNGDGTSCLSTGAGFYTCEAEEDGSQNAKQAVILRVVDASTVERYLATARCCHFASGSWLNLIEKPPPEPNESDAISSPPIR